MNGHLLTIISNMIGEMARRFTWDWRCKEASTERGYSEAMLCILRFRMPRITLPLVWLNCTSKTELTSHSSRSQPNMKSLNASSLLLAQPSQFRILIAYHHTI